MIAAMDASPGTSPAVDHPYLAEIERERHGWAEIADLCRRLTPEDRLRPGYYRDPDWSVKDLVAHLGTWMAEADLHLQRIEVGTETDEPRDIDALNAQFLEAMRDQDWSTVWAQAVAARAMLLGTWNRLGGRSDVADQWVRKAGAEHHDEHLPRLRAWVAELER
jgi:hypothetical protein